MEVFTDMSIAELPTPLTVEDVVKFEPTHRLRGQDVMRVRENGKYLYYDTNQKQVYKGGETAHQIRTVKADRMRRHLEGLSFDSDTMDLADLIPDNLEIDEDWKEPDKYEDIEIPTFLIGLCVEALKYSRATDERGNTAVMVDKETARLSVYKGAEIGGSTHYLVKLPLTVKLTVQVLEW